jgi:hypothetical protein
MSLKKRVHRLFGWKVPTALPLRRITPTAEFSWEDWHARMKLQRPVRFFLMETMPNTVSSWWSRMNRGMYWLKSVTYKKRHLLDLRQPKDAPRVHWYRYGFCDIVNRMPYAMFNMLSDYVEKELSGVEKAAAWIDELKQNDGPEHQIHTMEEALRIYHWWKVERIDKLKALDAMLDDWHKKRSSSESPELNAKLHEAEEAFEKELNDHMKALVDIRQGMWT